MARESDNITNFILRWNMNCSNNLKIILFKIIAALVFLWIPTKSTTCANSASNVKAIFEQIDSFSGYSSSTIWRVISGPISNSLYYSYAINSPYLAVTRRINLDGTLAWMAAYSFTPDGNSLSIDSQEQNLYLISQTSPTVVVKLQALDGVFSSAQSL